MRSGPGSSNKFSASRRSLQLGRLTYLEGHGLAFEVTGGVWKLEDGFLSELQKLSVKNDIIKSMHQRMRGINPHARVNILEPGKCTGLNIEGKVLHVGLQNELYDETYMLLETRDKKVHYVPLGQPGNHKKKDFNIGDEVRINFQKGSPCVEKSSLERSVGLELELSRRPW